MKPMKHTLQRTLLATVGIVLLAVLSACGSVSSPSAQNTTSPAAGTSTQPSPTQSSGVSATGTLAFYGTVRQVSANSITVGMPDGQELVMHVVAGQTDLSRCNNALPGAGQAIETHATANHDGSFTASSLAFANMHDQHDSSQVEYHGVTTSAVGADHMLHFQVGDKRFSFPISSTANLGEFDHDARSIGTNQMIDAHVQFQGANGTVVEVDHWDGH